MDNSNLPGQSSDSGLAKLQLVHPALIESPTGRSGVQGLRPKTLLARERYDYEAGKVAGITSGILVVALHVANS